MRAVRFALEDRHRGLRTEIIPGDHLHLDLLEDIVDLLAFHSEVKSLQTSSAHRFRRVCVDFAFIGDGEVFPRGAASNVRTTLAIARVNQNHCVPLLRLHGRDPRWRRPEP